MMRESAFQTELFPFKNTEIIDLTSINEMPASLGKQMFIAYQYINRAQLWHGNRILPVLQGLEISMHPTAKYIGALSVLLVSACNAPAKNSEQIAANAVAAEGAIRQDAEDRADRLDDVADDLIDKAKLVGGDKAVAMRKVAAADYQDAAQVRIDGQHREDLIANDSDAAAAADGNASNGH